MAPVILPSTQPGARRVPAGWAGTRDASSNPPATAAPFSRVRRVSGGKSMSTSAERLGTSFVSDVRAVPLDPERSSAPRKMGKMEFPAREMTASAGAAADFSNSPWIFPILAGMAPATVRGLPMRTLTALLVLSMAATLPAQDLPHSGDAGLRSIQFVDDNEGWAAGDDGVVWHTINGGKNWERQSTGTRASLRCVHFLNPYSGWAVGRV